MSAPALSAAAMAAALARGETSAAALAEAALARIAAEDGALHAFIALDAAGARAAAADADARRAAGAVLGPLDGVPVAVKDNIALAGLPCRGGTAAFPDPAPADATVAARLRAAGAVIIGTLNMHEGALGATTDNPFWGRCANPAVPGCVPGGSSGGSAAAVAAGILPVTLGSDTMGSVRIPAAYCGIWGLKPTRGLVPVTGLVHLSWTLDTIGPLAADPGDLLPLLAAIAGPDPADAQSRSAPSQPPLAAGLQGARIAVPDEALLAICEPPVRAAFDAALATARAAGAQIVPFAFPDWNPGKLRRAGLLVSEAEAATVFAEEIARRPEGFSEGFRAAIAYGEVAAAPRLALAYRLIFDTAARLARAMEGVDALLMPTAPQRAFAMGAPAPANQADFTALANIGGLPALAVPLPADDGGAPCSVQLVGHPFSETALVGLGRSLHERITA